MRNFLLIILSGLFVFLLGACARKEEVREAAAVKPREEAGGRIEKGFSHIQMEEGKVILKVEGDSVSGLDREKVAIENPRVERFFHGEDRKNSVEVAAQIGTWNRESNQVEMEEEVRGVVGFEEEIVIEHADKMVYEPLAYLLTLSGRVRLRQGRSILNADKVTIYLDEKGERIVKITAEGEVSGRIFPEELRR
ncbi:LptA/OstA family protein [candidate division NPL-UPA2 bacterium]|nr:LptA/OstA family protein [candidate division NPL-UPA2 bacterium]